MTPRQLYVVGFGLALIGSLAAAAGQVLAGTTATAVVTLGGSVACVIGLRNALARAEFEMEPSLTYRVLNWAGATLAFAFGLLMGGVGFAFLGTVA